MHLPHIFDIGFLNADNSGKSPGFGLTPVDNLRKSFGLRLTLLKSFALGVQYFNETVTLLSVELRVKVSLNGRFGGLARGSSFIMSRNIISIVLSRRSMRRSRFTIRFPFLNVNKRGTRSGSRERRGVAV